MKSLRNNTGPQAVPAGKDRKPQSPFTGWLAVARELLSAQPTSAEFVRLAHEAVTFAHKHLSETRAP